MPPIDAPPAAKGAASDDVRGVSAWLKRFRADRRFRQSTLVWLVLSALLALDVAFLLLTLPHHTQLLHRSLLIATVVLFPLLVFVVLVRSPWGRAHIRPGYDVRPFTTLKKTPDFDGSALAAFLEREIEAVRTSGARPNGVPGAQPNNPTNAGSGATLSVAGATVSIPWLWKKLLYAVSDKRDVVIEGLLLDAETPLRVRVWSSSSSSKTQDETLGRGSVTDSLSATFGRMALGVLEDLEPRTAGLIYNNRWRDAEANVQLAGEQRNSEQDLEFGWICLDGGYLHEADGVLHDLKLQRLPSELGWQAKIFEVQLRLAQGRFHQAQTILDRILGNKACPVRWRSSALRTYGDNLLFQGRYGEALEAYERFLTEVRTFPQLSRKKGQSGPAADATWEQLARVLTNQTDDLPPELVDGLLLDIQGVLSNCATCALLKDTDQDVGREAAIKNMEAGLAVSLVRDTVFSYAKYVETASFNVILASLHFDAGNFTEAEVRARAAETIFLDIESQSYRDLGLDAKNMRAQVDVAWCCLRLWVCESLLYAARKVQDQKTAVAAIAAAQAALLADAERAAATRSGEGDKDGPAKEPTKPVMITCPGYGICTRADTGDPVLERMATTLQSLTDEDRSAILEEINRASHQLDDVRINRYLWRASVVFFEVLMRGQSPGVPNLRNLLDGRDDTPDFADAEVDNDVMILLARYGPKTDLVELEVRRLLSTLRGVVEQVGNSKNREDMNRFLQTALANTRAARYGSRVEQEFDKLAFYPKRPSAEAAYGRACVQAIKGNPISAGKYIAEAKRRAGEDTHVYSNRVATDEHFLRILAKMSLEDFRKLA